MTNATATLSLLVDGVDVQRADFGIFLEIKLGFNEPAAARGTDTLVPSLEGRIPRNRVSDVRTIVLSGCVSGSGVTHADEMADFRVNMRTFRDLFNPRLDPYEVQVTDETGAVWTINARPKEPPLIVEKVQSVYADVSVALESTDPDWVAAGS